MSDLVIVGGLTIDRFADGSSAPGGTVIHAGRAIVETVRPAFVTVAGDEPEAADGLRQLRAMGDVEVVPSDATTTFGHAERDGTRVLTLERRSAAIQPPFPDRATGCALLAPIADELPAASVASLVAARRPARTVFLIQGWLRRLALGQVVVPRPLADVDDATWSVCAAADAIVVSTEDLAEAPGDPFGQAALLRARIGPRPLLYVTLGTQGHLLDDPAADRIVASVPRRIVAGVPTVGAGDTFGAALALHLARGATSTEAAGAATDRVIAMLEERRP